MRLLLSFLAACGLLFPGFYFIGDSLSLSSFILGVATMLISSIASDCYDIVAGQR